MERVIGRLALAWGVSMGASLCLLAACVAPAVRAVPTTAAINFVAPTAAVPAPSPTPARALSLRLIIAASDVGRWALTVAEQRGMFDRAALELMISVADDPVAALEPNATRNLNLALVPAEALVRAVDAGAPLRLVAGTVNRPTWSLVVGRTVDDFSDLQGRPLGVSDPSSITAALVRRLLAKHGLANEAYSLVALPTSATLAAGITNGTIDGALLDPARTAQLKALNFRVLGVSQEVAPDLQVEGVAARVDWARQNEEALLRFLHVLAEAQSWLAKPSNRVEATAMLAQISGLSIAEAREAAGAVLDQPQTLAHAGELNLPGVQTLLELIGESTPDRKLSGGPERYVDESYLGRARP